MKMDRDKSCNNSFCKPAATERRSKKRSRIYRMRTESLTTDLFWPLLFSMHRDFKRICKRYRLRLLRFKLSFDMLMHRLSFYMLLSCNIYCPKESKCRHLQNPSKISLVLPRYNQNQKINQKTNPCKRLRCIRDTPWAFFDLSSVAAGSQSAMQQYCLPIIYIIRIWI